MLILLVGWHRLGGGHACDKCDVGWRRGSWLTKVGLQRRMGPLSSKRMDEGSERKRLLSGSPYWWTMVVCHPTETRKWKCSNFIHRNGYFLPGHFLNPKHEGIWVYILDSQLRGIHSLIHSFNKYFMSAYYVSGTILGIWDTWQTRWTKNFALAVLTFPPWLIPLVQMSPYQKASLTTWSKITIPSHHLHCSIFLCPHLFFPITPMLTYHVINSLLTVCFQEDASPLAGT